MAEKKKLEEKMRQDPELSSILNLLTETDKEDIIKEERARRAAARQSRVETDVEDMETEEQENVSIVAMETFINILDSFDWFLPVSISHEIDTDSSFRCHVKCTLN